jgi:4-alpha-glucanotransferase
MISRISGILLHPTSLPGPHGSGDFGPAAFHFVDWLVTAAQSAWQVLPLTPIGPGNSPYASVSAFAGSPLLVAFEPLIERDWLAPVAAAEIAGFSASRIDFERVVPWRMAKLEQAAAGFFSRADAGQREAFATFCRAEAGWLDDYALFMALDTHYRARGIGPWQQWSPEHARRDPAALAQARAAHADTLRFWQFVQWCFFTQWRAVMDYARQRGVTLIGDLPIFVAGHSSDCWARPDLFQLDARLEPKVVAGVPPDYFSATGQRWGNPLYDWDAMQREGFAWWIARVKHELARADLVRIDHFRGFAGYWEIPADKPTAVDGHWVAAPGTALFNALKHSVGALPVIAEDLGVITPDVEALRDGFDLPGMKILQFAFGGDGTHAFLPHNYTPNCFVYTGTHDNDTARGWYDSATERERAYALAYLDMQPLAVHWAMIRAACASVARAAIYPMQDVLGLGAEARMNMPGQMGYWTWRFDWPQVGAEPAQRLAAYTAAYGRAPIERLQLAQYPAGKARPA